MGAVLCQVPPMPKIPTSRLGRTAKFGGLVAGQGARWAGTQAANRLRSDEQAEAADAKRALALADELVTQLGQMKGAAMKLGQVLSTIDFDMVPEGEREAFKEKLSSLRDDAPQVPFKKMEKVIIDDLGGSIDEHFSAFDSTPVAAASIGQVYRACCTTAATSPSRSSTRASPRRSRPTCATPRVLLPLVKRLAPGMDAKAILGELRERIGEELDYELEAQNQRRVARAFKGHPFIRVPDVVTSMSTRRVLITEFVVGPRLRRGQGAARGRARPLRRDLLPVLLRVAAARAHRRRRPASGQLPAGRRRPRLLPGLRADPAHGRRLPGGRAGARTGRPRGDADAVHQDMASLGYLPGPLGV